MPSHQQFRRRGRAHWQPGFRWLLAGASTLTVVAGSGIVVGVGTAGAAGGSVSSLSISVAPPTAGSQIAWYSLTFVATDGIGTSTPDISITAPNGTDFCDTSATIVDNTNPAESGRITGFDLLCGNPHNTLTMALPHTVDPGDSVRLNLNTVGNPSVPSTYSLSLLTNNDPVAASANYAIVTGKVGELSVGVGPSVPAVTTATYVLSFVATHGIGTAKATGRITIVAPNGTDFCDAAARLTDATNPIDSVKITVFDVQCSNPHNVLSIDVDGLQTPIAPGSLVTLTLSGVENPSVASNAYTLSLATNNDPTLATSAPYSVTPQGYWMVARDGGIFAFGTAQFAGSTGGLNLNAPIVGMVTDQVTGGYWFVASDGGIFSFNAPFLGSMGGQHLNAPIVGMAATPTGAGYWLVARDGGIFSYGNARFLGSMGGQHLNAPIVGMAASADGGGYWFVASDGGIFSFGDSVFQGSMGGRPLNAPIVGMATDPQTGGYWFVASDGGIFAFDAPFFGSMGGKKLNSPIVGMAQVPGQQGYNFVASDGGIFSFGAAGFEGSMGGRPLNAPIVGMAA